MPTAFMIIFALFLFGMAVITSNKPLDEKWKNYEAFMLTRGIQVIRTPQWEKQTKQAVPVLLSLGVLCLFMAYFVSIVEKSGQTHQLSGPQTTIKKNGMTLTMTSEDFKVCGVNPPDTCPPGIRQKYTWQNDSEMSPQ